MKNVMINIKWLKNCLNIWFNESRRWTWVVIKCWILREKHETYVQLENQGRYYSIQIQYGYNKIEYNRFDRNQVYIWHKYIIFSV